MRSGEGVSQHTQSNRKQSGAPVQRFDPEKGKGEHSAALSACVLGWVSTHLTYSSKTQTRLPLSSPARGVSSSKRTSSTVFASHSTAIA